MVDNFTWMHRAVLQENVSNLLSPRVNQDRQQAIKLHLTQRRLKYQRNKNEPSTDHQCSSAMKNISVSQPTPQPISAEPCLNHMLALTTTTDAGLTTAHDHVNPIIMAAAVTITVLW